MAVVKVALSFARLSDGDLDDFGNQIYKGLSDNATLFPTPPVTTTLLQTHVNDFKNTIAVAAVGGKADTAAKDAARQVLLGDLRQEALYVEMIANGDLETLLKSGFNARSQERASVPLPAPTGIVVTNDGEGKLNVLVEPVKNCSMYEGRAKPDGGAWGTSVFTGDSRHILFDGLTPGAMYTIQIRGLGGSTGTSDWSDPVQHRSL
jgi:hypothetical protein